MRSVADDALVILLGFLGLDLPVECFVDFHVLDHLVCIVDDRLHRAFIELDRRLHV